MPAPQKTAIVDVVGLTRSLINAEHMPFLHQYLSQTGMVAQNIEPAFPALTCTAQSTYLTGVGPSTHGITANGFYDRTYCEVNNWHQSAKIVQAPRIWDALKAEYPQAKVFVNCIWHSMHDSNIDFALLVRPQYLQDGGKKPDIYTKPPTLREELQSTLGMFPLHRFWGPGTSIQSSKWIVDASIAVDKAHDPTLSVIYLPHLDYSLQKYGPPEMNKRAENESGDDSNQARVIADLKEIDKVVQELVEYYESDEVRAKVVILSEYAISKVDKPVYLNRALREQGLVQVRTECGGETLDCGACRAFALCDHQMAHVHVRDPADIPLVRRTLEALNGVQKVMDRTELDAYYRCDANGRRAVDARGAHNAERSGELVAVADASSWFAYYYWTDDAMAPDFASCVAIHRKPGYDPAEMFLRYPGLRGFVWLMFKLFLVYGLRIRTTVDATPLRCDAIKGSHGRLPCSDDDPRPLLMFRTRLGDNQEDASMQDSKINSTDMVSKFAGVGGGSVLGREACIRRDGRIIAEDVYEVLWRILSGQI